MKATQYHFFAILGAAAALAFAVFPRPGHAAELLNWTPLYSAKSVALPDGDVGYQVECHGLLESGESCAVAVRRICDTVKSGSYAHALLLSQPQGTISRSVKPDYHSALPLFLLQALAANGELEPDYRSIMFQCVGANENGNETK